MRNIEGNLLKYKIHFVFKWYHFLAPILMIYALSFGIPLLKATIAISISFYFTVLLLEVPSGIFADLYGRRKTLILASFLLLAGIILFSFGSSFFVFLLAGLFWGAGMTFNSGAADAFLYDSLLELKREKEFKKIKGDLLFYTYLMFAASSLVASFLYVINPRIPFYLASLSVFVSFLAALTFHEPKYHKSKMNFNSHFRESVKLIANSRNLIWIGIYSIVFLEIIFLFTRNFAQPYLVDTGAGIVYFGALFALFRVFSSLGAKSSGKIEKMFGLRNSLLVLMALLGVMFFGMGIFIGLFSFLFICFIYFVLGATRPLTDDFVNKQVSSGFRATVISIYCLIGAVFNIIISVIVAYTIEMISLSMALYFIFGIILATIVGLFIFYRKDVARK